MQVHLLRLVGLTSVMVMLLAVAAPVVLSGCQRAAQGSSDDAGVDARGARDLYVPVPPRDATVADSLHEPPDPNKEWVTFFLRDPAKAEDRLTLATIRGSGASPMTKLRELTLSDDITLLGVPRLLQDLRHPLRRAATLPAGKEDAIDLGASGTLWSMVHNDPQIGGPEQLLVSASGFVPGLLFRAPICATCPKFSNRMAIMPNGRFLATTFGPANMLVVSITNRSWANAGFATGGDASGGYLLHREGLAMTSKAVYFVSWLGTGDVPEPGEQHDLWRSEITYTGYERVHKLSLPPLPDGSAPTWISGGEGLVSDPVADRVLFTAGRPAAAEGVLDLPREALYIAVDGKVRRLTNSLARLAPGPDLIAQSSVANLVAFVELDPVAGPTIRVEALSSSASARSWPIRGAFGAKAIVEALAVTHGGKVVAVIRDSDAIHARRTVHVRDAVATASSWRAVPLKGSAARVWLLPQGHVLLFDRQNGRNWGPDAVLFDTKTMTLRMSYRVDLLANKGAPVTCGPSGALLAFPIDSGLVVLGLHATEPVWISAKPPVGRFRSWRMRELVCSDDGRSLAFSAEYELENGTQREPRKGLFVVDVAPKGNVRQVVDGHALATGLRFSEHFLYYSEFLQLRAVPRTHSAEPKVVHTSDSEIFTVQAASSKW